MKALLALVLTPAAAQAQSFTGPHVEAIGGYDQTDVGPGLGAANGVVYGIAGGYDVAMGRVRIGTEAEINESTVKRVIAATERRVGRSLYTGLRFGVPLTDMFQIYVKGGFANGRFSGPVSYTGSGFRAGGGGEVALGHGLFARGEYRYSDYGRTARGQTWVAALGTRF
jgi:outer membrane immunogenic protein